MTDIAFPILSKRRERAQLVQQLHHAAPALALLWDGVRRFGDGGGGLAWLLGSAELVTSALVIASVARAFRAVSAHAPRHHSRGPDWLDIFLAGMLATEAGAHWHDTGHLPRPTLLLAAVTLAVGIFHDRLADAHEGRATFRVTTEGITVRETLFARFTVTWDEIARLDLDAVHARVVTRDARERRFDFRRPQSPGDIDRALAMAPRRLANDGALAFAPTT